MNGGPPVTRTARSARPLPPVRHPGVVDAKVGYFGVKSTKVYRVQMGTKSAKSRSLGPRCAKVRRGPHPAPTGASAIRSSIHAASKVAKVGAAGGPKLLKWGRLRARQGQICYSPTAGGVSQKGLRSTKKRSSLRGRTKVAKVGPLRARVKSAKVRPTPYVYYPRVKSLLVLHLPSS